MSTQTHPIPTARCCPVCGLELPVHVPAELCPKCLLKAGLGGSEAAIVTTAPETSQPVIGEEFGHYRIVEWLGAGGMGAVYEAEDIETGRRVALKVLSHRFDSPEARQRFLREGRLAAAINHPNSVYVFATEEIGGIPVIAMELMPGGTLEQRVHNHGPLDINAAVDATLNIIEGLEAAYAVGILHRDIKPSNCFLDADGTVKIGDFGLSISTDAHYEPRITVTQTFMGTPAFASPEQLRGDELTVRSDIYSVGVTLFYLLTGRLPHESNDMVRILAKVLENPAPSPDQYRQDIPARLGQLVQRCLEKCPGDRFKSYSELRCALVSFSSKGTKPAELHRRFLAGLIDCGLVGIPLLLLFRMIPSINDNWALSAVIEQAELLLTVAVAMIYFTLPEWRLGRTPGKSLLHLRVVNQAGQHPVFPKALLRGTVFIVLPLIIALMHLPPLRIAETKETPASLTIFGHTFHGKTRQTTYRREWSMWQLIYGSGTMLLLFCAANRRNGYAALHDWLTDTRVVSPAVPAVRPALTPSDVPAEAAGKPKIGPFHLLDNVEGADDWFEGYDCRLFRRVWIHKVPVGSPPVYPAQRNLSRPGRLRWITGKRSADENWDAYEALSGSPLVKLLNQTQPWKTVRFWLLDVATELQEAQKDGTLPKAPGMDRVWITADGRAKILDFPAPGAAGITTEGKNLLAEIAARFLDNQPLPVPVREFLNTAANSSDPVSELQALMHVPVAVSLANRLGIIAVSASGPALLGLALLLFKQTPLWVALMVTGAGLILLVALPAILAAAITKEGLLLRTWGVAIVGKDGKPATGTQTTRRSLFSWLPCLLSPAFTALLAVCMDIDAACLIIFGLMAGFAVLSAIIPDRGLPDRLAGTWLVPR